MIIGKANIKKYTTERVLPNLTYSAKFVSAEEIKRHTYVNNVWRINLSSEKKGDHDIYLRQALDHIKVEPEAKVPPQRIFYEFAVLKRLYDEVFIGFDYEVTPKPYFLDKGNFIIILSDVRLGSSILVEELAKGNIHLESGGCLGSVLGTMHGKTWGSKTFELDEEGNKKQLERHFFNRLAQAQEIFPEPTKELIGQSNEATTTFVAGDFASKNIFIHQNGKISFVDLERSFVGDPAFDIGFLLGHYQLEVIQQPGLEKDYQQLLNAFRENYKGNLSQSDEIIDQIFERANRFVGAVMLYRLYGRAKSGEIKKELENKMKAFAHKLLTGSLLLF